MQTIRVTTAIHDTTRLLVDDHDLIIDYDIFVVFLK